jgi:hypothetical protein
LLVHLERFPRARHDDGRACRLRTLDDEVKCLEAIASARQPLELVPTFLGAHDFPARVPRGRRNTSSSCASMLLRSRGKLSPSTAIFTRASFSLDDSRRILERARSLRSPALARRPTTPLAARAVVELGGERIT